MSTSKTNGAWNLFNEYGVLVYRGSFEGLIEAMKGEWNCQK